MNVAKNQFDRNYRAHIEKQVLTSIMKASTDPDTGKTTVRTVEAIDALICVISRFAGMQVTSIRMLDEMSAQHQRVLKERTENYYRQYQLGNGPNLNIQREYE
ncbi:hypothetical protein MXMO3_00916 [Maritalea myrionectae]|uniref:Uncharacterized protein n=1 Tax=Maritalea myrionectae TaxID=454601 RepID=A0A2R4MBP4_9HYPH|nr:hypothetical protein [Maritalea myrionectae]AVX03447.1 hypothetical protein MXMO3_00916 [Maritalea myrionectae]